ncbi:hypothetical protein PGB90_002306 [Kerria lacca]
MPVRIEFPRDTANIISSTSEISRSASLNVASSKSKPIRPSFKSKWKSFRSRTQTGKKSEGDLKNHHNDSPTEDFFIMESFSDNGYTQDELSVKICKESIRQSLLESVRILRGNDNILIEMENTPHVDHLDARIFETLPDLEKNYIFLWAAFITRIDYLELLYNIGADITFTLQREGGFTALHLSSFSGCVNCVKWLIERGCDINVARDKYMPLHYAVLGNSLATAQFLVNHGCLVSDTVLHAAVLANAVDCVQFLMKIDVNVTTYEQCGMTPLHVAADRSLTQCLKVMLDYKPLDVDVKTNRRQATALHLASENGHHKCVQLLIEKGAGLKEMNYKGQTALHLAAKAQSCECVDELLKAGSNVNAQDVDQRTPLHSAVCKPQLAFPIVELLVSWKADVNLQDRYGYSPLHVAALNELSQCVDFLIMNGANVGARTKGGLSALSIINRKTPTSVDAIKKKLDESLSVTEPEGNNRELRLKLDFRYILQNSTCGEIGFLQTLKKEGHREILEHPLCIAFLHLKWNKVRTYYFIRLGFCTFFIILLSLYVMTALAHDCYNAAENEITANHSLCKNNSVVGDYLIQHREIMEYIWYLLVFCNIIELIRKLYSTPGFSSFKQYFLSLSNIIEWLVIASIFAISCVYNRKTYTWQNHIGAFAVLSGWSILMIMIGQLPVFGTYIAMYTKVQKEFVKLLMAYCCLLIGFTISFCVIFPTKEAFSNPLIGFVKVLAMMTGELEVNNLLLDTIYTNKTLLLQLSAYLTFVLFLFFVTVVLINLLVGIAVHDIEGLHKTAGLAKLVRQTELIYSLELALFHGYLPTRIMNWLKLAIYVSPRAYRVVLYVRPLNPREKRLPRDVMERALTVARAQKKSSWTCQNSANDVIKQKDDYGCLLTEIRELRDMIQKLLENHKTKI